MAESTISSTPDDLLASVKSMARQGDARGIEHLLTRLGAQQAAEVLATAQQDLYWTDKDISAMVTVSRIGIAHMLKSPERSTNAAATDPRHDAKALAYNLASFTWPGWNEPGVTLSAADVADGFQAARLNLRLAEELHKPQKAIAKACWLLGAHQLAAAEYAPASDSFRAGKEHAHGANDASLGQMLDGYLRLTDFLYEPHNTKARNDFDSAITRLSEDSSDDSRAYATQLTTALSALLADGNSSAPE